MRIVEEDRAGMKRRSFLGAEAAAAMAMAAGLLKGVRRSDGSWLLRPPGALPEAEFLSACQRCFRCVNACPNDCIQFHGLQDGLDLAFTPYIRAREKACTLCGECAQACPTGAIASFEPPAEGWIENVDMGSARLNKSLCFSYNGRTCGACYRACPLPGHAMKIGVFETPILQGADACVGCGLCEQACLHLPQAIRVVPKAIEELEFL